MSDTEVAKPAGCECPLLNEAIAGLRELEQKFRVLVVLSYDGTVEVYAARSMQVKIAQRLFPGPLDDPKTERLCDEYLDATLPRTWRELFMPVNLQALGRCEVITGEAEQRRRWEAAAVRELREMGSR